MISFVGFLMIEQHQGTHIHAPTQHKENLLLYCIVPHKLLLLLLFSVCTEGPGCYLNIQQSSPWFLGFSSRYTSFHSWLGWSIIGLVLHFSCLTSKKLFYSTFFPHPPSQPFNFFLMHHGKIIQTQLLFLVPRM
jgi:hypothetical protein